MHGDLHIRFLGGFRLKDQHLPNHRHEKLIEYKTCLQALPNFDHLEGRQ